MLKVLDEAYVEKHLTTEVCISLMEEALKMERSGECIQYLRTAVPLPNTNILGIMPSWFDRGYFGAKVLSVYHTNGGSAYPSHQGEILLFAKDHGQVLAIVDAMAVTKIRTGAVSAAASAVLANPGPKKLAILGCGAQGASHLEAMAAKFPSLETVALWDAFPAAAQRLAENAPAFGNNNSRKLQAAVCTEAREAVSDADIICTVTPSSVPVLEYAWVKKGAHINAVGACAPHQRELDSDLAAAARFFGDNRESVFHESGDFLFPLKEGRYGEEHFLGTVGDIMLGKIPGRTSPEEITIFEALGMAVEDIACAIYLYEHS